MRFLAQVRSILMSSSLQAPPQVAHVIKNTTMSVGYQMIYVELVEPLRELFKDEVRILGALGLPPSMVYDIVPVYLGVRILGEVHKTSADILRKATRSLRRTSKS